MTHHVIQERYGFCFLACLSSFLTENGVALTQREILARLPDAFGKGDDLGAFSITNFSLIENEFGLEVMKVKEFKNNMPKEESVFVLTKWKKDDRSIHWVRLLAMNRYVVLLMNPDEKESPQKIPTDDFMSWTIGSFLVKIRPPKPLVT